MISGRIIIIIALLISMLHASVQAQDALLVYSPCANCPGCFADCALIPPDAAAPVCPVCQEGAPPVALPRTGQALCYNSNGNIIDCAGTGQDGHIQAGVAWPDPRFTDNLDGSMTDNLTGLVWLKDANRISTQYPGFDNDGSQAYQLGDGLVTLQHAYDFVRGINDGTYPNCGASRTGWRLPNINEIESLMNVGEIQPLTWLTGQDFQNLLTNYYWSSTTYTYGNHQAWVLDFYSGNPYRTIAGKYSDRHYPVWPVSGTTASPAQVPKTGQVKCYSSAELWGEIPCAGTGQDGEIQAGAAWPLPRFIDNSDGTVTDNLTGLMWLRDANCFGRPIWQASQNPTWQSSLNIISDFNANPGNYTCSGYSANYNDWRLANINEQESLFNAAETNHSVWLSGNGYLFLNVQGYWYWSSTSRVENLSSAVWVFDMISGVVAPGSKNFTGLYVWPVRTAPPRFILTVTKQGAGSGTVTSDLPGINCGDDCTEPYDNGTEVTLQAAADAGFEFINWGGDPDCSDGVVTMNAHKTCTATFDIETHTITVTKDGTGTGTVLIGGPGGPVVCGNDCQETYNAGIGILLDAIPFDDSEFTGWSGDPDCEDGHILMDADKTCNATFNLQSHRLIIGKPGNGSGTVTSVNVAGINCGNDCSELYSIGAIVTLQATPDPWNNFSWGGDPDCNDGEVTIGDADVTCFAVFNIQTYTLTVSKAGTGSGVVITNEQGGINCGLNCASSEKACDGGTEVTLTAGTDLPWIFTGWSGDPDCADGVVTMNTDKTCIATFIDLEDLQFQQMQMLRNESQKTPEFRIERGIPRFISMRVPIPAALPDDPGIQALDFLDRYKYLYRINAPKSDLYLKRIKTDRFNAIGGGTPDPGQREQHLFFGQQKDGIPVYSASLAVHMKGDMITSTSGNYPTDIPDFKLPAVQSPAAEVIALADVQGNNKKITGVTKLFYYNRGLTAVGGGQPDPADTPTKLAWRVIVSGLRSSDGAATSWMYLIDAQDGAVLKGLDLMREHDKDIRIESVNNTESDTCWDAQGESADVQWFDENGPTSGYPGDYPGGDTDGDRAFTFIPQIYDFFHDTFGRHSYDNRGKEIEIVAHVGVNWRNAGYSSSCDDFKFGDGFTLLDVMAHEFTHGIDASKDDGGLIYENQSGALDESYGDVFGEFVEAEVRGAADWLHAVGKPGGYNRNLANPPDKGDPEHMNDYVDTDDDYGGVHTNSGIPNKAAFLLVAGGVHPGSGIEVRGIGIDKAQRLYYDVHTARLTENSQFIDARDHTVEQAEEYRDNNNEYGFSDSDVCSVMNAFAAVGLGLSDIDCDGMLDNGDDDNDNDGIVNLLDNCPYAVNPSQLDRDDDGSGNACDFDSDNDGKLDGEDNCIYTANADQADWNNNGTGDACDDSDGDGVFDSEDNCLAIANPDRQNSDNDEWGDACDGDDDNDGVWDNGDSLDDVYTPCPTNGWIVEGAIVMSRCDDNCRTVANPDQTDTDEDGFGDECDNCDFDPNSNQADNDNDGIGDVCDPDDDNDGVDDAYDNCQFKSNPDQINTDLNDIGLACDPGEAFMLSGNFGDFFNGTFSFPSLTDSIKLPVFPCIDDGCPDWIAENYMTEVSLTLPSDMQARIVDDKGFVISKGKAGMTKTMSFHPAADSFFRFAENMPSPAGASNRLLSAVSIQQSAQPTAFKGQNYFVEIYPSADVIPGQPYSFTVRVKSRLIDPLDIDNDGYPVPADCNDNNASIHPGAAEVCDGVDNNCDGNIDEGIVLDDGNACTEDRCDAVLGVYHILINADDGNACTTDVCDPVSGVQHIPINTVEICDGIDNNCNGQIDEGVTQTWYRDGDNDGYSNGFTTESCDQPEGFKKDWQLTATSGDCDDAEASINPGAVEACEDGLDSDCDGAADPLDSDCIDVLTLPGDNVIVRPIDPTTGTIPADINFSLVNGAGITNVTTGGTGLTPPPGFKPGNPAVYYEISTTAVYSGQIQVCINYSGTTFQDESKVKLFHYENGSWLDVTSSLDTVNNIVCGNVSSLSPFAIFEPVCNDTDGDGVCDDLDNCLNNSNPDQVDSDGDGKGDVCDPITDLYARAKSGKVDLVWSPVTWATGYNIYRSTTQGGPYPLIKTNHQTSYCVYSDTVPNGITYYYIVRWINSKGRESIGSNEAKAMPVATRSR